jgi:hypothetical protein
MTAAAALQAATRILSPKQIKSIAMSESHTLALWVGAVSGGKTIASLFAFLFAILRVPKGEMIVVVGRTIHTIERNVLAPLQSFRLFGPVSRLTVHTAGASSAMILGRRVELIGASNVSAVGRIQGGSFRLVYVDEATLLPEPFWDMLVTRLRPGHLIATTNPASRNHWLRRKWILRAEDHDLIAFHFTMHDNPSLAPEYIARMMRSFVGLFFERFILGKWTTAEGAIYSMFNPAEHVIPWEDLPPIRTLLAAGMDHGTRNPTSVVLLGITDERDDRGRPTPRLVAIDEWRYDSREPDKLTGQEGKRLTNAEQSALIRPWLADRDRIPRTNEGWGLTVRPGFLFVDPAAADMREQLSRDRMPNSAADHAVEQGISDVMTLLGQGRLLITDRCAGILEEITEYVWDPKKSDEGEDYPLMVNDHSLDALRYAVRSSRAVWLPILRRAGAALAA